MKSSTQGGSECAGVGMGIRAYWQGPVCWWLIQIYQRQTFREFGELRERVLVRGACYHRRLKRCCATRVVQFNNERFDTSALSQVGGGVKGSVYSLKATSSSLLVGGEFSAGELSEPPYVISDKAMSR